MLAFTGSSGGIRHTARMFSINLHTKFTIDKHNFGFKKGDKMPNVVSFPSPYFMH